MGSRLVSRSSLSAGEQDAVRRRCLVPQPQLDADTSHMLDTSAAKTWLQTEAPHPHLRPPADKVAGTSDDV